jgi:hypothetical protein
VLVTLAVFLSLMTTGLGPHENRMIPPAGTAAITAAEVQLAAVPRPTTRLGCDVSTGRPVTGTGTRAHALRRPPRDRVRRRHDPPGRDQDDQARERT